MPITGIACAAGGITTDTSYLRRFFLTADHAVTSTYKVASVDFGVEVDTPDPTNPITVNTYEIPIGAPFLYANMTLLDSVSFDLGGGTDGTLVNAVVGGEVDPATDDLVVEIVSFDHFEAGTAGAFFPGANSDGQTQPSYIAAPDCAFDEPTDLASLGFPDSHNVMVVNGSELGLEKELTSGPDNDGDGAIDVVVPVGELTPTAYDFTITWNGDEPVSVDDTVPAEWDVTHIEFDDTGLPLDCGESTDFPDSDGMVEIWRGGKPGKKCNSDTSFRWMPIDAAPGDVCVSQEQTPGAGDFELLGAIQAFNRSAESATAVYSYNFPAAASYNGTPPSISDTSQLFLVNTNDGGGASLFVVHDTPNDGAGGSAAMTFDVAGDSAAILVRDDPGDGYLDVGGTQFFTSHNWVACCTDGVVLGTLEGPWLVDAQFTSLSGMSAWQATSADGTSISLVPDLERRVRLSDCGSINVQTLARCHDNNKNEKCRPTSCGALYLNYGAIAYLKDPETGEIVLDDNGDPIVVDGPTDPICLAAVKDVNGDGTFTWDGSGDEDGDTLPDYLEACEFGTDPCLEDTDGDGVRDDVDECPLEGPPDTDAGEVLDPSGCIRQTIAGTFQVRGTFGFDLDLGAENPTPGAGTLDPPSDIWFSRITPTESEFVPVNGATHALWGAAQPSIGDCDGAALSGAGINFAAMDPIAPSTWLCAMTDEGRLSSYRVFSGDASPISNAQNIVVEFVTWD